MNATFEQWLSKYSFIEPLVESNSCQFFRAQERKTERFCTVQSLIKNTSEPDAGRLLEREIVLLNTLDYSGIARLTDKFVGDGEHYLVVSADQSDTLLLDSLKTVGQFDAESCIKLGLQMCEILEYLHANSIIHGNLNPACFVLREDGDLILFDLFGARPIPQPGSSARTIEQESDGERHLGKTDALPDLYGLGKTLIHLITGHEPRLFKQGGYQFDTSMPLFNELLDELTQTGPSSKLTDTRMVRYKLYLLYQLLNPEFEIPDPESVLGAAFRDVDFLYTDQAGRKLSTNYELLDPLPTYNDQWWRMTTARHRLTHSMAMVREATLNPMALKREDIPMLKTLFDREKQVLRRLNHPGCLTLKECFLEGETQYHVFDLVTGLNLYDYFKELRGPLEDELVVDIAVQICDILDYLHSLKPPVIYRNLTPQTVLITGDCEAKLVNFSLSHELITLPEPLDPNSTDGVNIVSQGYSAPECYWGGFDTRCDIYSLGAVMHYLLTGKEPLALTQLSPQELQSDVSPALNRIVENATAQDVKMRFQSIGDMKSELAYWGNQPEEPEKKPWWRRFV